VPHKVAGGKFEIGKKLGSGCFGEVYRALNSETQQEVAVKLEDISNGAPGPQLEHEATLLNLLRQPTVPQGFAEVFYFGKEGPFHCLVMEFLGKTLEDKVRECTDEHFSIKTGVLVAEQILRRIEYLHSKGITHRDIKPENFCWGVREKQHHLYLIDFGLSKRYWDKRHIQSKSKLSLTGTARYASLNAHKGLEQSRRDDLEAIGHMLVYFVRGSLPWSGLEAKNKQEKYRKIQAKKESLPLRDLCSGYPNAFVDYLRYARNLGFRERPDYEYCRKLFHEVRKSLQKEEGKPIKDHDFEWFESKDMGQLAPLPAWTGISQPDDRMRGSRALCCFCGRGTRVTE